MAGPWDKPAPPPEPVAAPPPPPAAPGSPASSTPTLSCPSCGGTIELKAAGYTVTVVCQYCGSVLDVANPDVRIIQEYHQAAAELTIPLGTRGTIGGIAWEVIGYLQKSEDGYPWEEYLLFNPYHGYRWLITDGRGWSFGTMLTRLPQSRPGVGLLLDDQAYRHFADGGAQVDYVLGEFYWRVRTGDSVRTADYVRPGWMLSWEGNDTEDSWTLSELLKPSDVQREFGAGLATGMLSDAPPMPHQPSPYAGMLRPALTFSAIAVVALFVLAILFGGHQRMLSETMTIEPDRPGRSATLGPVTLTRPWQAVTIEARAPTLENAWVDLDYSLVNRATQESFDAYGLAERYSGRDSDGSWSEGSRAAATKLAMLPAGSYDLLVDAEAHNWTGQMREVQVQVTVGRGATFWGNLILAMLLILFPMGLMLWRHFKFEQARLAESDHGE